MEKVDYALEYAKRGWAVIALSPNSKIPLKHNLQPHGVKNATTDLNSIIEIWSDNPNANIGIATGEISSITVLDLDGMDAIEKLKEKNYQFVDTYIVKTPRGWHHYYQYDSGVPQSAGRIEKCDIRNDGGYVVGAGSEIDGKFYKVVKDINIATHNLPEEFFNKQPIKEWVSQLNEKQVTQGMRNNTLFRYGCSIRANKTLSDSDLEALIKKFNEERLSPPLDANEVNNIIKSCLTFQQGSAISFVGKLIEPPMIESQTDRRSTFYWTDYDVRVTLTKISHMKTNTYCRMQIWYEGTLIYFNSYSIYSETSRKSVRDTVSEIAPLIDWSGILQHITQLVNKSGEGELQVYDLATYVPKRKSPYLLNPIVRENQGTIIYADGGSGKSTFALSLAISLASGVSVINGISPAKNEPVNSLYLDWEADIEDVGEMKDSIKQNKKLLFDNERVKYIPMSGAFIDRVDEIVDIIVKGDIKLVIVDSLVASAGGDVNDAEAARLYFQAVRSLKIASIGITHTNKEGSLYGNRFFWNLARQVYRMISVNETGTNPIIGLFHEKANRSQLMTPMAWEVEYADDENNNSINYKPIDIQTIPQLAKLTSLKDQLISLLKNGGLDSSQISTHLGESEGKITRILYQYKTLFQINTDKVWGLK
tara:strand:+ start:173 stop:2122 length:1950 start_codon:yes stop_codon:yes gene_type:complete